MRLARPSPQKSGRQAVTASSADQGPTLCPKTPPRSTRPNLHGSLRPSPRVLIPTILYCNRPYRLPFVPCVIKRLSHRDCRIATRRTMPTPDDAIPSPVEHESTTSRTTCPPDEARIANAHELNASPQFNDSSNVGPTIDVPMQLPTPPSDSDSHSKPSSARIEAPNRDTPTPMTATDDGAEEHRASQASPLAPGPGPLFSSHLTSPFPAQRVRHPHVWSCV